jgi:hypothetical protein
MGDEIGAHQFPAHFRPKGRAGVGQPAGADFVAVTAVLEGVRQVVEGAEGQPEDAVGQGQVGFS